MMQLFFLLFLGAYIQAQSPENLEKKSGFKDIVLGDSIKNFRPWFKYLDTSPNGYEVYIIREENPESRPRYGNLGYLPLQQLNLLVFEGRILEIRLFFLLEQYQDIQNILYKAYGPPNGQACETTETEAGNRTDCAWQTKRIGLWSSAINLPENQKVVVGFQHFKLISQMRRALTQAALKDL
ncbi:MAG: hypothetical protein HC913_09775 [Microscillaceae bacterium]|nr:hypothetical protein [Microscillaceae bacterium]